MRLAQPYAMSGVVGFIARGCYGAAVEQISYESEEHGVASMIRDSICAANAPCMLRPASFPYKINLLCAFCAILETNRQHEIKSDPPAVSRLLQIERPCDRGVEPA